MTQPTDRRMYANNSWTLHYSNWLECISTRTNLTRLNYFIITGMPLCVSVVVLHFHFTVDGCTSHVYYIYSYTMIGSGCPEVKGLGGWAAKPSTPAVKTGSGYSFNISYWVWNEVQVFWSPQNASRDIQFCHSPRFLWLPISPHYNMSFSL